MGTTFAGNPASAPANGAGSSSIVNQPPGESFLLTEVPDDRTKIDLDYSPRACRASMVARARVATAMYQPTAALEAALGAEMLVGGATALTLFRSWIANGALTERNFPALDGATA